MNSTIRHQPIGTNFFFNFFLKLDFLKFSCLGLSKNVWCQIVVELMIEIYFLVYWKIFGNFSDSVQIGQVANSILGYDYNFLIFGQFEQNLLQS